ncbi:MAG: hypothetical protein HQ567_27020 [Candidatus Nealsonbacteria bacterium]|nr:hypothetical protein [Candidatus Nealsonbacteria bacterium]
MSQGLDEVNRAIRILVGRNATLHQRLYEAAKVFADASHGPYQWPKRLANQADELSGRLTAKGNIAGTVNSMDATDAREVAEEMLELATALNVATVTYVPAPMKLPIGTGSRRRLDVAGASS